MADDAAEERDWRRDERGADERPGDASDCNARDDGPGPCLACGARLVRVKLKWMCPRCGVIHETCCDGGGFR